MNAYIYVNSSFQNVLGFKYVGVTLTNTNEVHKEKRNLGNISYCTVEKCYQPV
jgi:hypothetical protein